MKVTERFRQAFEMAFRLHRHQMRKGKQTPYIGHLLAVCSLVLEAEGTEDEAIAALLHDAAEDHGGTTILTAIHQQFGAEVAEIVAGCSDSLTESPNAKSPWQQRKEAHLATLPHASASVRFVYCADKLHNARSLCSEFPTQGDALWSLFCGGKSGTLWYYREVTRCLQPQPKEETLPLANLWPELQFAVERLEALAGE